MFCKSLTKYERFLTREISIGGVFLGGEQAIRVQSMTTSDTMDTEATVQEVIDLINVGCELVRITAPSIKEAENLGEIKNLVELKGYKVPLIADIHYTPNAAEVAARLIEKVRVNPGNYADKKKFESLDFTDESYQEELDRINEKFTPLVQLCKERGTVMRIGTNHGSLSDRILSRFGDTPAGMVESALEFIRICEENEFYEIVISMKASNTQVMVQAYRLLVSKMIETGRDYPLHLGVTEAGDGEDGRIKSAVGIGTLLEDGIGDTIRVSLTEDAVHEIPVAKRIIKRYENRSSIPEISPQFNPTIDFYNFKRRITSKVKNIGAGQVPVVISDFRNKKLDFNTIDYHYNTENDKWHMGDMATDYVLMNSIDTANYPENIGRIIPASEWQEARGIYPLFNSSNYATAKIRSTELNFIACSFSSILEMDFETMNQDPTIVLIIETDHELGMHEQRNAIFCLASKGFKGPVVINRIYESQEIADIQINASIDFGALLIDGLIDGIILSHNNDSKEMNQLAFGILQATRARITKTEYIACPSCGRTLFDLQDVTALIRQRTSHLKGVKIGIMGCIVNGPGEMADADYGYVGSGVGKITLYRGQTVVEKSVDSEFAVDKLIELIKEDKRWVEPILHYQ